MRRGLVAPLVGAGLPALALAAIGTTHPTDLTMSTAGYWRDLHIVTLVIFPLLGLGPWLVVRGLTRVLVAPVVVLCFGYAAFYTALDVLSGIGAGSEEHAMHADATSTLFAMGSRLGDIGSWCLIAACAITGIVAALRWTWRTAPFAVVALIGSVIFLLRHIYFPVGVIGQLCLAVGWVGLLVVRERRVRSRPPVASAL